MERNTLVEIFLHGVRSYDSADALRYKEGGRWRSWTYRDVHDEVVGLASALHQRGITRGDRVALLSENRPEWAVTDFAVLGIGAISVPLYPTLPADQVASILADCGARAVLVSDAVQLEKVRSVQADLPELEFVFVCGDAVPDATSFDEMLRETSEEGDAATAFREQAASVRPDDVATLIYTSGTTGTPKGVMLTHANLAYMVSATREHGSLEVSPRDVALSLLPLSHVFERAVDYYYWDSGVEIAYAESVQQAAENLREVRPHVMVSVPRLFEKIYAQVMSAGGVRGRLVRWAAGVADEVARVRLRGGSPAAGLRLQYRIADRLVFARIRERTGGRIRTFISGGAPLSPAITRFFHSANLPIHEGYGLTETSPVLSANRPGALRPGAVGVPYPRVEMEIAAGGEILARSPGVMKGYWHQPEATAAVLGSDGWFHTGDIGHFDAEGFLHITDRLKDIIVTAGGKNIAPQPIESEVAQSPYIAQAVMIGDQRPYPVLLVVPDLEAVRAWAEEEDLPPDTEAASPTVRSLLEKEALRRVSSFARFEQPKKIGVITEELTIEDGLLTPTLKVKRKAVMERYRALIEGLYA